MPQAPDLPQLNQFDLHPRLAGTRGPVLVLFSAPGCAACRHWRRWLPTYLAGRDCVGFLVDVEQDLALAREFEVWQLPALFLYHDGDYHCALHSPPETAALDAALQAALARPAEEAP